ncbi:MAG: peptide-methionine (S)-S-oxide reductase MsrA [Candidatus Melainabacteria bacterium]|jgi:peptide-methionine (S)-S-oxide reductase
MENQSAKIEKAIFAAGCFWGVEEAFSRLPGVTNTKVGYIGGKIGNPTYKEICTDTTGHAEAVEIEFDSTKISYGQLLDFFWEVHDPTTLNRQGPDYGSQYRSAIFYFSSEQEQQAQQSKEKLNSSGKFNRQIVTQIISTTTFYDAEDYHQQYLKKNPRGYCHISFDKLFAK